MIYGNLLNFSHYYCSKGVIFNQEVCGEYLDDSILRSLSKNLTEDALC